MNIVLIILGIIFLFLLLAAAGWILRLLGAIFAILVQGFTSCLVYGIGCLFWGLFILGILFAIFD